MKMDEQTLLRYLTDEAQQAFHYDEELAGERNRALKAYLREPYGNEEEGRSSVVASDVFDAVEGILPDLVEVFVATDKAVVFDPVGPEDEEGAEQATNACNHVFYKQNNGFFLLYTAAKDALLLKTGGIKWWWDKKRTATFTTYKAVDEMQLAVFLTTNPQAEVVEREEVQPTPEEVMQAQQMGMPLPVRYTVKIKTVEEVGRVKLAAIPPNELHISRRHNSILLDDCPYVGHVVEKTVSEIKEMGYDVSVDDVKSAQNDEVDDEDRRINRRLDNWEDSNELDPAMVRGWLREEYVLVDFDGDGIAERRRIVRLGTKILANDEVSHVQIAAWTPYLLTHRFDGLSVADLVGDFQRISTEIVRQQLDNLYLANNQETIVLTDAQGNPQANIDDLLNRRPGGVIRERVQGAVRPYQERWQGIEAMPMVEMLERAKERRTGYSPVVAGLDANALNKTATEVAKQSNERQKRMKLMARVMAEALVAPMFRGIFKTLTDYCMEKLSFRLNGRFVAYDPQEWRDGYDMSINVGIGTGDTQQQLAFLMQIAQAQAAVAQSPYAPILLDADKIRNVQARMAELAGFKNPGEFWNDAKDEQGQVKQPPQSMPPQLQVEQMKLQADVQKEQAKAQVQVQTKQAELEVQRANDERDSQREMMLAEYKRELEVMRLELDKYKVDADNRTRLLVAQIAKAEKPQQIVEGEDGMEVVQPPDPLLLLTDAIHQLVMAQNAPKQVIRDETGRAVGVAPIQGA